MSTNEFTPEQISVFSLGRGDHVWDALETFDLDIDPTPAFINQDQTTFLGVQTFL